MSGRRGAFFDVDKTILSENSGTIYLRFLYERGEIDWRTVVRGLASYLQYKVNLLDLPRFTESAARQLKGFSEESLRREVEECFERYALPVIYPEARELVREHRESGDVVALVSGATRYVTEPLARHLGVEHVMHTHMEVTDGHFTGRVIPPVCFGEGKIYWLQQLIERERIDLARTTFYTDSITDLPLLDVVGYPVVVNPDPLLYREARRRRWPVRIFTRPRPDAADGGPSPLPEPAAG